MSNNLDKSKTTDFIDDNKRNNNNAGRMNRSNSLTSVELRR
jgi:hypothetical protein